MSTKKIFSFVFLMCLSAGISFAQFGDLNKIKNKAKNKVEKAKDEVENTTDEAVNGDVSSSSSTSSSSSSTATVSGGDKNSEIGKLISETADLIYNQDNCTDISQLESQNYSPIDPICHAEGMKKLDFNTRYNTIKEKGGAFSEEQDYINIMKFSNRYAAVWEKYHKSQVNDYIEQAYKEKQYNVNKGILCGKKAKALCEAMLLLFPDNAEAKSLLAESQKTIDNVAGDYYKKVFTSEFHKQNVGKVLFSKTPIAGQPHLTI